MRLWSNITLSIVLCAATALCAQQSTKGSTAPAPDLFSFASGALIVQHPSEYDGSWSAIYLLDENANTGWATAKGITKEQTIVIEMPAEGVLSSLEFDTANVDGADRAAKNITVEVSSTGPTTGFVKVADVTLRNAADGQKFPVHTSASGRWVKLIVHDNYGSPDYLEVMEVRGYGTQAAGRPSVNVSGTYSSDYGDMHIRQEGTAITGCYEHDGGLIEGGLEGRVMKVYWRQTNSEGPAVMVFTNNAEQMAGLWWFKGNEKGNGGLWDGKRKSTVVGSCPHWSGGIGKQMHEDLSKRGTSRVYGINFDSDSDVLKNESKTVLDEVVAMLKSEAAWKIEIDGHTDSTATAAHNQQLSERRAESVKTYLVAHGIDSARLTTRGFGATQPVAPNETDIGRAQNRRVELVKK